jgi:hypothetical protein
VRTIGVLAVLALAPAAGACGDDRRSAPPVPAGADTVVVRVDVRRSLEPPWDGVRIPEFSLYGDGRVIVPGRRDGALVVAREFRLDSARTTDLYRRAYTAGLDRPRELTDRQVLDGWSLVVTVATPDGPAVTTVTNPGRDHPVQRFADRLPREGAGSRQHRPPGWVAVTTPPLGNGDAPRPWPFTPPLAGGVRTRLGSCTPVAGSGDVEAVARAATQRTRWDVGGEAVGVIVVPLLPDWRDCRAIGD